MVGVMHLEIGGAHVIVIDSMLNVLHVVVGDRHTNIAQLVNHFFLRVLSTVPNAFINTVELLSESFFSFFSIDLAHLLEL
jgi:hypothetical protein